jgi:hypothetical protein
MQTPFECCNTTFWQRRTIAKIDTNTAHLGLCSGIIVGKILLMKSLHIIQTSSHCRYVVPTNLANVFQEVDMFDWIDEELQKYGYVGLFRQRPKGTPDGVAIFYKKDK